MRMSLPQEGIHTHQGGLLTVAPWPGGQGGPWLPLLLRAVGKLSMLSERRFKMLSGKIFGLSEKIFGLSEKYCPCPPPKKKKQHGSHGATAYLIILLF